MCRRCLDRQIAAHPLAANRAVRTLQANRLESLPNGALAAPSHARVKIIHRSNSRTYPICSLRPVPDVPAGPVCSKWRIEPSHKIWRREPPASLQAGRRGATTGFAPPLTAQRWTFIEHGRPRALPSRHERRLSLFASDGSVDLEFIPALRKESKRESGNQTECSTELRDSGRAIAQSGCLGERRYTARDRASPV